MVLALDRDGVLVELVARLDGYRASPQQFHDLRLIKPAVDEALAAVDAGWDVVLWTNQPDMSDDNVLVRIRTQLVALHADRHLTSAGLDLDTFCCPHGRNAGCECRKPKTRLLEDICRKYNCRPQELWVVGDRSRDIEAANNFGCHSVFVKNGQDAGVLDDGVVPDKACDTPGEAIQFACRAKTLLRRITKRAGNGIDALSMAECGYGLWKNKEEPQ